jgi:hypothetical protein
MMTDEEALRYLEHLREHEMPAPKPEREKGFIARNGQGAKVFGDVYGYFAASLALDWYNKNSRVGVTLGECIRNANTGLYLASYEFIKKDSAVPFKDFAKPFILKELSTVASS